MPLTAAQLDAALAYADTHIDQSLDRLTQLIAIKSISTDPAYKAECQRAADWLVADLKAEGFDASARPTPGHPVVVAHAPRVAGPKAVFYAHYDVQPVDPLALWNTDPFTLTPLKQADGETHLIARGTSDDKGQMLTFIEACRALRATTGGLPINITLCLEGEEEVGRQEPAPLPRRRQGRVYRRRGAGLRHRYARPANALDHHHAPRPRRRRDRDHLRRQRPSLRHVRQRRAQSKPGAGRDYRQPPQSGRFGGVAGFYDDVKEVDATTMASWQSLGFDGAAFLKDIGLAIPAGEQNRSVLEQTWSRPTCEINGMVGGYTGDGFKTVIPAKASAKISFRLVADMDPDKIRAAWRAHARARIPADCSVTFAEHGGSPAISVPTTGKYLQQARAALADEWGRDAALRGSGGSIPVAGDFKRILGLDTLLIGYALADDRIHSPNEKYNLRSYHKGIRSWIRILAAFAA